MISVYRPDVTDRSARKGTHGNSPLLCALERFKSRGKSEMQHINQAMMRFECLLHLLYNLFT